MYGAPSVAKARASPLLTDWLIAVNDNKNICRQVTCIAKARASPLLPDWLNAVNNSKTYTGIRQTHCAPAFIRIALLLFYLVNRVYLANQPFSVNCKSTLIPVLWQRKSNSLR